MTLKIAFWGIDLHQENYGWWWYALNCIVCKWNLSPLFWTWNLAKLKYWYYEMHLTMKNHIIIHSNVFFIIKLGVVCVCCRNITGSGKKNWLWGIFHIAKCPNFYELIYDFSGQKISKNGISRQSSNYKDSFFCKSFLIIKTCRVLHRECHLFSWYLESYFGKWISMRNFIMNVPQTLTLFQTAFVILAMQK